MTKFELLLNEIKAEFEGNLKKYLGSYKDKPLEQMPYYKTYLGYQEEL